MSPKAFFAFLKNLSAFPCRCSPQPSILSANFCGIASSDANTVLTVYDKPLADSSLVKVLKQRVLEGVPTDEFLPPPARWRSY
jgi:hypothetical protein